MKPALYNLNSPQSFQLIKSYSFVFEILEQLEDHHDATLFDSLGADQASDYTCNFIKLKVW